MCELIERAHFYSLCVLHKLSIIGWKGQNENEMKTKVPFR